jgi:hypothetical protein
MYEINGCAAPAAPVVIHMGGITMGWWSRTKWLSRDAEGSNAVQTEEEWGTVYQEVRKAQSEWERAYLMFDEALGQDQIDYAIYILEAAERKYQIHLKHAKSLGLDRSQLPM